MSLNHTLLIVTIYHHSLLHPVFNISGSLTDCCAYGHQVVLCNSTLLQLLHMSGSHVPLEDALAQHKVETTTIRPLQVIPKEERKVLHEAVKLVKPYVPELRESHLDISNSLEYEVIHHEVGNNY